MVSSADSRDLKKNFVIYLENADFSREINAICKTYGFDLHNLSANLPDIGKILSVGFYVFVKVWDGATRVNKITGRLITQIYNDTDEDPAPIKYLYRDYDFTDKVWTAWSNASEELSIGTIYPDNYKIFWKQYSDGVLRGAAGNLERSYPVQLRYINRKAIDDNGFFHDYTYENEHDRREYEGLLFTRDFPKIKAGLDNLAIYEAETGGYSNIDVKWILVPVYDGHQIARTEECIPILGWTYLAGKPFQRDLVGITPAFLSSNIRVYWEPLEGVADPDYSEVPRITGFNIYETTRKGDPGVLAWSNWKLVKHVDLRTGGEVAEIYDNTSYTEEGGLCWITLPLGCPEMYKTLYEYNNIIIHEVRIPGTGTYCDEEYPIDDITFVNDYIRIYITPGPNTGLETNENYTISIIERWREMGFTIPPYNENVFFLRIVSKMPAIGDAPDWLPDPEIINDDFYQQDRNHPQISGNYSVCEEFEDRNTLGQIYIDDEKKLKMVGYSNPKNHDFAGYDIIADYINPPLKNDDEIMGFGQSLNILSVFTKYDTFKYNFESGAPILAESPYNVGLVARRSLVTINGIHWFLGRKLQDVSIFRYDGIHEPQDMGKPIKNQLDDIFKNTAGLDLEGSTIGWYDNTSNQYRISFNCYVYPVQAT